MSYLIFNLEALVDLGLVTILITFLSGSRVAIFFSPNRIALYLSEATWIENKYQSLT